MKVLLLSNWNDQCGISEYGKNLYRFMDPNLVEYVIRDVDEPLGELLNLSTQVDVVHINHQIGVARQFDPASLIAYCTTPIVYTNHYAAYTQIWFPKVTVVQHVQHRDSYEASLTIPFGIVDLGLPVIKQSKIILGHAGFPFGHKRGEILCSAAAQLRNRGYEVEVFITAPNTRHSDPSGMIQNWEVLLGDVPHTIVREWLEEDEVIKLLNEKASVCVFPGGNIDNGGASGSARLGISAKKPIVVNKNGNYYHDIIGNPGIFFFETDEELPDKILEAQYSDPPLELLARESWQQVGKMYASVYKSVK